MDSGNSGSMQSSSGGDEEYDPRSESISAFKNNSSDHIINQQQQQPIFSSLHHLSHTHHQTSGLDPMSNFLDPFSRSPPSPNQNPHLNFDMVWARGLRSEPNCTDTGGFMGSSSSSSSQLMLGSHHQHRQDYSGRTTPLPNPAASSISSLPHQPPENGARDHHHQAINNNNNTVRNSKKRSRASRRAPTTVLTTDTSNFRAMVQEFTGIPAPPFSMASPFSRTRLDLFRTPTTMRSGNLEPTPSGAPPYLLRPFAHKIQPPSYLSSSHSFSSSVMADGIVNSTTSNNTNTPINNAASTNSTGAPSNFASTSNFHGQLLSDQPGLAKHTQNLLNMQHPVLTLQSLLNTSPPPTAATNYSLPNVPDNISSSTTTATVKSQGSGAVLSNDIPHLKMGLLEELDMNHHGHVGADQIGGLPMNLVVSEGTPVSNNTSSRWGDGIGLMHDGNDPVPQRSFSASYGHSSSVQQANGCSSSDFHAERASDQNISSRGEGMVDSWICSSD